MKVIKTDLMALTILICIFLRICIDTFFSGEKPFLIVLGYTALIYIVSIFMLFSGKVKQVKKRINILILLFISLFISLPYSDVPISSFIVNALQIYTPCFFLVASISNPLAIERAATWFRQYLAFPTLLLITLAIYRFYLSENIGYANIFDFYDNNPNHVLAQTLLKFSLIMIDLRIIWITIPLSIMLLINVRSVILSYIITLFYVYRDVVFSRSIVKPTLIIGVPVICMALFGLDWSDVYARIIFKGLEDGVSGELSTATSGRTEIYQFYISFIMNNFSFADWLFGNGPIWLSGFGPRLSAHNDILNSIVTFGITGLFLLLYAYYQFYKALPIKGKSLFLISFTILFLTNGVLFHQSNVLFILLFFYIKSDDIGVLR